MSNFGRLASVIAVEAGRVGFTEETKLKDLGLDSLEFLGLLLAIENEFEFKIPDEATAQLQTVGDILRAIA